MADKREQTDFAQLKLRLREPLRARLEESAKSRGTSLNAETVLRLERSYDRQDLLTEALKLRYDGHIAGLLISMGTAMDEIASQSSPRILLLDDPDAYAEAVAAIHELLRLIAPKGPVDQALYDGVGKSIACELAAAIRAPQGGAFDVEAQEIRDLIGLKSAKRPKP